MKLTSIIEILKSPNAVLGVLALALLALIRLLPIFSFHPDFPVPFVTMVTFVVAV